MGGNKKVQRTKGNTRPSSSGRSAELLSASGVSVSGFVGFSALSSDLPSYVPAVGQQLSDDVELTIDGDFRLAMKKMSKRDATTKLKALHEFMDLCQLKDEDSIKRMLPFWPRLYVKLAVDCDRRVREATHYAHECLVSRARRNLAPHLKSIMGVWVVTQCDPHAPAASAAQASFRCAFPKAKQSEAVMYCLNEICSYIQDILFKQTSQSISDPKITSVEDMESKFNRIVSSCLQGLKLVLELLSEEDRLKTVKHLSEVLSKPKFWKFPKSNDPQIRGSWYSLVSKICQLFPDVMRPHTDKICPLTFCCIGEEDPVVAPFVWEGVLSVLVKFEDCWSHVNVRKAVLPHLWTLLKEGGKGNADKIFCNLLPFLSKIPENVIGVDCTFYELFFGNMRKGLSLEKVMNSHSECNSIIQAYFECLKYVITQQTKKEISSKSLVDLLVVKELLPMVEVSLMDPQSKLATSDLYPRLGELLRYLECVSVTGKVSETFQHALTLFWEHFFLVCDKLLDNNYCSPQLVGLERLANFFHSLHYPDNISVKRKKQAVKFLDLDDKSVSRGNVHETNFTKRTPETERSWTLSDSLLVSNTHKLCKLVFEKLKDELVLSYLKLLAEMIGTVGSPSLFAALVSPKTDTEDAPYQFFLQTVKPWLQKFAAETSEESIPFILSIVDILFSICFSLPSDSGKLLLDEVTEIQSPQIVECLLERTMKFHTQNSIVRKWLQGDALGQAIQSVAEKLVYMSLQDSANSVDATTNSIWRALQLCFTATDHYDPLIASSYMSEILMIFQKAVKDSTNQERNVEKISRVIEFVCDLASNLFTSFKGCWKLKASEKLLLTLFLLCCRDTKQSGLSELLKEKVSSTWQTGVRELVHQNGGFSSENGMLQEAVRHLKYLVTQEVNSMKSLNAIIDCTWQLLTSVYDALTQADESDATPPLHHPVLAFYLENLLQSAEQWNQLEKAIPTGIILENWVKGHTVLLHSDGDRSVLLSTKQHPPQHIFVAVYTAEILLRLHQYSPEINPPDEACGDAAQSLQQFCHLQLNLPHILLATVYSTLAGYAYKTAKESTEGLTRQELHTMINKSSSALIKSLSTSAMEEMLDKIGQRAPDSVLWTVVLSHLCAQMENCDVNLRHWHTKFASTLDVFQGIEHRRVLQHMVPFLSTDCQKKMLTTVINLFLCLEDFSKEGEDSFSCLSLITTCCQQKEVIRDLSIKDELGAVLNFLHGLKSTQSMLFACCSNLLEQRKENILFSCQVCHFFLVIVQQLPTILTSIQWDFLLCLLADWMQSCSHSGDTTTDIPLLVLMRKSSLLLETVSSLVGNLKTHPQKELFPPDLSDEWQNVFVETLYNIVLQLFFNIAEKVHNKDVTIAEEGVLESLGSCLEGMPVTYLLNITLSPIPATAEKFHHRSPELSSAVTSVLQHLCPLLTSGVLSIQLGAHHLLTKLVPELPKMFLNQEKVQDEEEVTKPPPAALSAVLDETSQVVEILLSDFRVGDCCIVQPYTDSYTYCLAYFLIWMEVMDFFSATPSEGRSEYASYLKNSNHLSNLLGYLFRLMPSNPTVPHTGEKQVSPSKNQVPTLFSEPVDLSVTSTTSSHQLQHLACQVYLNSLKKLPALVRQWWTEQDKRTTDIVNRFTSKYVSSLIYTEEIQAVHRGDQRFKNLKVKARPAAREVMATYTIDEVTIELVIQLSVNHPLGGVTVDGGRRVGVSNTQWRNWLLQLTTFLTHQNGTILDGLALWKKNVDKRFEGVEECMICFYVLHGSTCQLPRLSCRTCKKKFHSACLYKWFNTSQKSTCPLCREFF
ncbi:E3 ubiquitin-protein ligase listerin [Tachypleus tridentatus]|uniref:E3 ubiquitin-protein ligase listerin n=1 Tax=Tachypleus tridentatus TaxID=6853 RepID=UPI003FD3F391